MRTSAFVSCLTIVLACSGCEQGRPGDDQLSAKVQALETNVNALQKRVDDLALKTQITSGLGFGSPLDNFFNSPEFWENTYDSGQADCSKRCIKVLQTHRAACAEKPEAQRLQCYQEASSAASKCHVGCAGL